MRRWNFYRDIALPYVDSKPYPQGGRLFVCERCAMVQEIVDAQLLLDVGAGSGAMLGAFSEACSDWKLSGLDLDDTNGQALEAIPRFEQLF